MPPSMTVPSGTSCQMVDDELTESLLFCFFFIIESISLLLAPYSMSCHGSGRRKCDGDDEDGDHV